MFKMKKKDINIMSILAKSSGVSLIDHSNNVLKIALHIANQSGKERYLGDFDVSGSIKRISLLHDIGKAEKHFQEFLKDPLKKDTFPKGFSHHQEISWAFLKNKVGMSNIELSVIYWHHSLLEGFNKDKSVGSILENVDTDMMEEYFLEVLKEHFPEEVDGFDFKDSGVNRKVPIFYDSEQDDRDKYITNFLRMCIYSADRIASELEESGGMSEFEARVASTVSRAPYSILSYPVGDGERFSKQLQIVEDCGKDTLLKAPAGFGKTLTGLLWASKSNKKLIWVCPRNSVATSVYGDILKELGVTGNSEVSVELYLTGEKVESNINLVGEFNSDIIVTNIDNFVKPNADLSNADKLFMINNCDVVFDEFHELISESALFAAFDIISNTRLRATKSKSLYLSATPSLIDEVLFPPSLFTVLPSREAHYKPAHQEVYNFNVVEDAGVPSQVGGKSNLFISNTISVAQRRYIGDDSHVFHSKLKPCSRQEVFVDILEEYKKSSARVETKRNVIGTHIIQASLDISFNNLYESLLSPESTLQRIGRCNRWGDYQGECSINVYKSREVAERAVSGILYDKGLQDTWYDFISVHDGKEMSLMDFYSLYNDFNRSYSKQVRSFIKALKSSSHRSLEEVFPPRKGVFVPTEDSDSVYSADGNKYRSTGSSIFYLAKNNETGVWEGPFTEIVYSESKMDKQFKEGNRFVKQVAKVQEGLRGNPAFNYGTSRAIKNRTLDDTRRMAKMSNSPYIRFDVKYDNKLGIIKNN